MKNAKIFLLIALANFTAILSSAQINVTSTGSVMVGSILAPNGTAPTLQCYGNALFATSATGSNSAAYIQANNGFSSASLPDYSWWYNSGTGIFHPANDIIAFSVNATEGARLNGTGLLIGNSAGTDRLDVYGANNQTALTLQANFTNNYGWGSDVVSNNSTTAFWLVYYNSADRFFVYGSGQAYAYGYNTLSDARLKENVAVIPNALDKVLKLRGVNYTLKPETLKDTNKNTILPSSPPTKQMGLIAQEVEQVVPEVVSTTMDGLKAVAYQNLVGLLVEALKEEDKKVSDLQNQVMNCCSNSLNNTGGGSTTSSAPNGSSNNQSLLYQNQPNPFNQLTSIQYYILTNSTSASLMVFNMEGKLLKTIPITTFGNGNVTINGNDFQSGMYMYSLIVNNSIIDTKKMILTQ